MSHIKVPNLFALGICLLLLGLCCLWDIKALSEPVLLPEMPLLTEWTQAVVNTIRVHGARHKLADVNWPKDQSDYHPIRQVGDGRVIYDAEDAREFRFCEISDGDEVVWGSVRTGRVRTYRYQVVAGPDCLCLLFLHPYEPVITHVYRLKVGQVAEAVSLEAVPGAERVFHVGFGKHFKPGLGAVGFEGPISVFDARGNLCASGNLPAQWGVLGDLHQPKATKDRFLLDLLAFKKANSPHGLPDEAPPAVAGSR